MFARIRPAARTLRSVRAYSATPVAFRAQAGRAGARQQTADEQGGKILLMTFGAVAALVAAGKTVVELRAGHVHPSEPKEEEETSEEAVEEVAEADAEVVEQVKEAVSAAGHDALTAIEESVAAVDAELESLVQAAEAALGIAAPAAAASAALPDPSEAASQGAFNEETGEINWDCPCLGGMAHGPCGEEFKAAFSCFVYSEGEPKGIECVEKFKGMQDCFRQHPDVYAEEIEDDDEAQAEVAAAKEEETKEEK